MNDIAHGDQLRSQFLREDLVSLADVVRLIEDRHDLKASVRRDLLCALNTIARMIGQPPATIPANTAWIAQKLRPIHPSAFRMSRKRFANVKADLRRGFELAGVVNPRGSYFAPPSAEWAAIMAHVKEPRIGWNLSRLSHFCSAVGLPPSAVDDSIMIAFQQAMEAEQFLRHTKQTQRSTIKAWNQAAQMVPGWPQRRLTEPPKHEGWTLPLDAFSESFCADLNAWLDRLAGTDPLATDGPVRPLRPATIKFRRFQVRMFASAVVLSGVPIEKMSDLTAMLTPTRFKAGLRYLLDRNKGKPNEALPGLVQSLRTIIRHWAKLTPDDKAAALKLCDKFKTRDRQMGEKSRRRLRQFNDPAAVQRLLCLPGALRARVIAADSPTRKLAFELQMAVAIEILTQCPVRAKNLAALQIGRHLLWMPAGTKRRLMIVIPGEETKNSNPFEAELPAEAATLVRLYLDRYHPLLTLAPTNNLFPSHDGRPKKASLLSMQIRRTLMREIGVELSAHGFRHLAALIFLKSCPGNYEGLRRLLGHDDMDTTSRFYAGLESTGAVAHYDHTILNLRRTGARAPRRRKVR